LTDKERKKLERVMPSKEAVAEFIKKCGITAERLSSSSATISAAFSLPAGSSPFPL